MDKIKPDQTYTVEGKELLALVQFVNANIFTGIGTAILAWVSRVAERPAGPHEPATVTQIPS